jgi:hypothetical protein
MIFPFAFSLLIFRASVKVPEHSLPHVLGEPPSTYIPDRGVLERIRNTRQGHTVYSGGDDHEHVHASNEVLGAGRRFSRDAPLPEDAPQPRTGSVRDKNIPATGKNGANAEV